MARISLIIPTVPSDRLPIQSLSDDRRALEDLGHAVEVLVVVESGTTPPEGFDGGCHLLVTCTEPGRAPAAIAGVERSQGDLLLVLDPRLGHDPSDLLKVVEPLDRGDADLVVASRLAEGAGALRLGLISRLTGRLAAAATGTSDPLSGLIGLTRDAKDAVGNRFHPVGTQFSFEILAKVGGRWADVPLRLAPSASRATHRPVFDDVRQLKRLSDHRFGNLSRLIQYCVVGGSGMFVDLTCYFLFQALFSRTDLVNHVVPPTKVTVALALSRALAIGVALVWNFWWNRRLTFNYAREGSIVRQFLVYIASNALGVSLSLALSLGLPRKVAFFNHHKLFAAVVGIVVATGVSFSMSRWVVFRRHPSPQGSDTPTDPKSESSRPETVDAYRGQPPVLMERVG